jgi:hypothetical protein
MATATTEQVQEQSTVSVAPRVGQTVPYYPGHGEDLAGGDRGFPAIVVSVDGPAPDYGLAIAVIDLSARMVARSRPISRETWEAAGADPAVAHWEPTEPRAADAS